jgi:hypothetical protein
VIRARGPPSSWHFPGRETNRSLGGYFRRARAPPPSAIASQKSAYDRPTEAPAPHGVPATAHPVASLCGVSFSLFAE